MCGYGVTRGVGLPPSTERLQVFSTLLKDGRGWSIADSTMPTYLQPVEADSLDQLFLGIVLNTFSGIIIEILTIPRA